MTQLSQTDTEPLHAPPAGRCMVVIPCLNEARHIGDLIAQLIKPADRLDMLVVVADGGSTDGTRRIVNEIAALDPRVVLLDNPRRLQAAAVSVKDQPTRSVPRWRVLLSPPQVLIQPNPSSIRLRMRWLRA